MISVQSAAEKEIVYVYTPRGAYTGIESSIHCSALWKEEAEELFTALSRELGCRYVDSLPRPPQEADWDEMMFVDIAEERDNDNG